MKKTGKNSNSAIKIIGLSLFLLTISGAGAIGMSSRTNTVTIELANGYKLNCVTSKSKVSEVLKENNIVIEENEKINVDLNQKIENNCVIKISDKSMEEIQVSKISKNGTETTLNEILDNYSSIIEKIVVVEEPIPYETVTKDVSGGSSSIKNMIVQQGQDGIKQVTYKIRYKNGEEISRVKISEVVVKEAVNKIVQIQTSVVSRSSSSIRENASGAVLYRVTAYCPCAKCCGKYATGYTASGTKATAGRTIATSSQFKFGTKLLINGKVYVVEDRGGAIQGNRIDLYCNTHKEALAWGVKYLPVTVVK